VTVVIGVRSGAWRGAVGGPGLSCERRSCYELWKSGNRRSKPSSHHSPTPNGNGICRSWTSLRKPRGSLWKATRDETQRCNLMPWIRPTPRRRCHGTNPWPTTAGAVG